jgi:alkyl hydroperoxide reductase subunit AhpC
MAQVGEEAPEWSAPAYINGDQQTVSSEDLEGDWYVLYWYPMDFTFVCPTEIREFQNLLGDFKDDGVKVIGASTDSFFSHKNWFEEGDTFDQEITHPVLADTNHEVSKAFGMLKEDEGVAFRGTAIVDPEGTIRSLSVNDLDVGRSPQEVLRTTQALLSGGMCGADWESGDDFVA